MCAEQRRLRRSFFTTKGNDMLLYAVIAMLVCIYYNAHVLKSSCNVQRSRKILLEVTLKIQYSRSVPYSMCVSVLLVHI